MSDSPYVGQRLSYDGALCTVRYVGQVAGTTGLWLGVEWDDHTRGKHDGSHKGHRYFATTSRSALAASFIRPTRRADQPQPFLSALREKYAPDADGENPNHPDRQIVIFGTKVAQEMGFDKIQRQLAKLEDLKIVILDGMKVAGIREEEGKIGQTCPSIMQLDLSRNLLEKVQDVVHICRELGALRELSLSGNRLQGVLEDKSLDDCSEAFDRVTELALEDTLLDWHEITRVATAFTSLGSLNAGSNQLSSLPSVDYASLASTLTSLNLEYNDFTSLEDLSSLQGLTNLRSLHLKGNNLSKSSSGPVFPVSIQYLDVSYNQISSWSFVDSLPGHFPSLSALRIAHNPIYEMPDPDAKDGTGSPEDAYMFTIARMADLKSLNYTAVSASDRANAEMFYLSRIARQLGAAPESEEAEIKKSHPRWTSLCEQYGEPDIVRRNEINPAFLEARLVNIVLRGANVEKETRVPKSFDIYRLKGIAGKLLGLPPLGMKLVWETGEWDPVAGYEDVAGDSSDDEDNADGAEDEAGDGERPGRWVRREVELKDGPRQLGYCVDGLDAVIRVERV
ncbi:tubulin-specific chaperone [Emericellopsis cladophorae]|uniref:Tubulin-specific chaperone n=1 Tax=Emericellopsis cladophorae TaxID=2686198 RepID=A0A9Q0BFQ1_9HYPO|nr:tubulin-specific chaperone [Emericellopsis cladophorae]KAI6783697.1 tubulin-specific chaperone [Emericellopsis cladophorae]